ncbi:MAG: DNA mismatch repair protein MutS [Eubacteriales bacterium SKADARSKE-1]|nr:DNA mismatch repair protein MutS [Eubacteriales bacterium SKADARSKE-1]
MAELSPMMKQYFEIKEKNKDSILFFRLGDFYEMFYDDAELAAKELELTLTGRDCGQEKRAPMCGIPYHSCESYIARLIEKGYKVAICEQIGDVSAKGLVKRDIIRVVTPGTILESDLLDESKNNFMCSLFAGKFGIGFSVCDVSTGELSVTHIFGQDSEQKLKNELTKFSPKEILLSGDINKFQEIKEFIKEKFTASIEALKGSFKNFSECELLILKQFKKESLTELNIENEDLIFSLAELILYLQNTQKIGLERISSIDLYSENEFMRLDLNTCRNLELVETMKGKEKTGSLLWVLDKTKTAMGKRLIRTYIERPLLNCMKIIKRQNAIEELFSNIRLLDDIGEQLDGIYDLERLLTKVVYGSANARDLRAICYAVSRLPTLKEKLNGVNSNLLNEIKNNIDSLIDIKELIDSSIVEADIPVSLKDGGIIKQGYDLDLDELRDDLFSGTDVIAKIEAREKEKTGITKLKIGYNRVFGYYIEVSNSYKNKVPESYIRKQTLTNCERYITQELKELEGKILGAKDRAINLEYELFVKVREKVASALGRIQKTAQNVAQLDVLYSLSVVAYKNNYTKPEINNSGKIIVKEGRHPVVELLSKNSLFVPNDVLLDKDENRVAIITGPNMAGKSTYMRQIALITLMAQIGSFVPAVSAQIGIVDSIFTRVGASDDLASGQSTFMVEMSEVANIIKNATLNSLLILDEIGRGTSTFDGMSIARAVLEYVADKKKLGAKTLFATHYHELTILEDLIDGVKNYNIAAKKRNDDIIFLRRIVRGGADDSYGVEVAKLAGIPEWIISRAKKILNELETQKRPESPNRTVVNNDEIMQISLENTNDKKVIDRLKKLDVTTLTPIESMNILFEISSFLKSN